MLSGVGREGGEASLTQVHPWHGGLQTVQLSMGAEQQVLCIAA